VCLVVPQVISYLHNKSLHALLTGKPERDVLENVYQQLSSSTGRSKLTLLCSIPRRCAMFDVQLFASNMLDSPRSGCMTNKMLFPNQQTNNLCKWVRLWCPNMLVIRIYKFSKCYFFVSHTARQQESPFKSSLNPKVKHEFNGYPLYYNGVLDVK